MSFEQRFGPGKSPANSLPGAHGWRQKTCSISQSLMRIPLPVTLSILPMTVILLSRLIMDSLPSATSWSVKTYELKLSLVRAYIP